jgi:hypothetical protein
MSIGKTGAHPSPLDDDELTVDVRRIRQAIETAQRGLAIFPETEEVRRLMRQAAGLTAEVARWASSPPSPDTCDRVMRSVMAIHVGTVQVARAARAPVR